MIRDRFMYMEIGRVHVYRETAQPARTKDVYFTSTGIEKNRDTGVVPRIYTIVTTTFFGWDEG
jgi:hypothetical protein